MSKIERALSRARSERTLMVVAPRRTAAAEPDRHHLIPARSAADPVSQIELRTRSSQAIALMREVALQGKSDLVRNRIISAEMADSATVQAFREIRTKILQRTSGQNAIIMVTSVAGQGGSSFVALNLGAAFAFDAAKTALLVDCNLRNPWFHNLMAEPTPRGLTDYLENEEMDIAEIIHPVGIERLRVIPAGGRREIPGEYFTSFKMKQLMGAVVHRYPERFIIIDAPPMTESADTQILSELCDFTLLVVPYGRVTDMQIENCVKAIDGKKLLGVVFNNEPHIPAIDWMALLRKPFAPLAGKVAELLHKRTRTKNGTTAS